MLRVPLVALICFIAVQRKEKTFHIFTQTWRTLLLTVQRTYNVQTCKVQQVVLSRHLERHSAGGVLLIGQLDVLTVHWAFRCGAPLFAEKMVSFRLIFPCFAFFLLMLRDWELTLCLNLHHFPALHSNSHTTLGPRWSDWSADVTWSPLRNITAVQPDSWFSKVKLFKVIVND